MGSLFSNVRVLEQLLARTLTRPLRHPVTAEPPSSIDTLTDEDLYRLIGKINDDNAFRPPMIGLSSLVKQLRLYFVLGSTLLQEPMAILTHDHDWMPTS